MAFPLGLLSYFLTDLLPTEIGLIDRILISLVPTGLLTAAFSFYLKNFIRSISKRICQFRFFKEDESYMPTTELLLWNNKKFSDNHKKRIRDKIKRVFNITLYSKEKETKNEQEARRAIAEIVPQLRNKTRNDAILFDYNCYFGSIRNALGGSVIAMVILITLFFFNLRWMIVSSMIIVIPFVLYLLYFLLAKPLLKYYGYEYARKLFDVFLQPDI
jgi:hypothetical protein